METISMRSEVGCTCTLTNARCVTNLNDANNEVPTVHTQLGYSFTIDL